MIGFVHQDRIRIMVDGDLYDPARGKLDPCGRAPTAGEIVHNDLIDQTALCSGYHHSTS